MKYKKSPFEKHISSLMSLRANHLISCQGEQRWLAAPKTPANHSPLLSNIKLNQIILPQGTHAQEGEGVLWNTEMYQHNFHGLVFDKISVRLHLSSPHFSQLLGKRLTRVSVMAGTSMGGACFVSMQIVQSLQPIKQLQRPLLDSYLQKKDNK